MDTLGVVIALVVLFVVTGAVMVAVAAVKAGKAVARKVERHEANARRAVENAALKAKSFTKPGSHGRLASLRLSLRTSLDATRQVLEGGLAEDGQLADSLALLARLDAHAAELDREMRILEREPDATRLTARLPELRERAGRITHSAETMRWAAQDRMRRFADDELARLGRECEDEAGALRHWDTSGTGDGSADTGTQAPAASSPAAGQEQRRGIAGGARLRAEDVLGLGEPLSRLTDRLRKPNTGGA